MSLLDAFRNSPLYRTFDNNGNPVYTFVGSAEDKPADGVLIRPNEGGFDTEPNSETIPGLFHLKVMDEFITGIYTSLSVDEYGNFLPSSLEGGSYSTDGGGQFSSVNLDNEDFIWIIDNFETLSEKYSFKSDASSLSDAFQTWIDSREYRGGVPIVYLSISGIISMTSRSIIVLNWEGLHQVLCCNQFILTIVLIYIPLICRNPMPFTLDMI